MRGISLNNDKYATQALASGALNATFSFTKRYKLDEVLINFSQSVYETVTTTLISANGSNYNQVLDTQTLGGEKTYIFRPLGEANFNAGDTINVQCTNANGIGIAYAILKSSQLGSGS